jgi:hypothetical protein
MVLRNLTEFGIKLKPRAAAEIEGNRQYKVVQLRKGSFSEERRNGWELVSMDHDSGEACFCKKIKEKYFGKERRF